MVKIAEYFISQQTHLYVLQSHRQFRGGSRPLDKGGRGHSDPDTWLGSVVVCYFSYLKIVDILVIV